MGNIYGMMKRNGKIGNVKKERNMFGTMNLNVSKSNLDSTNEGRNLTNIPSNNNDQIDLAGNDKLLLDMVSSVTSRDYCNAKVTTIDHSNQSVKTNVSSRFKKNKQKDLKIPAAEKAQNNKTPLYKRLNLAPSNSNILNKSMQADVSDCWRAIVEKYNNDHSKIGLEIYERIFEICPELRSVFQIPRETVNVNDHAPFHRSTKLFASMIDLCIRNIHGLETEMGAVLIIYGRRHYHRQKQGFHVSYFTVFEQCLLDFISDNISDNKKKPKLLEGWYFVISYIRSKMTGGVELEKQRELESCKG